MTNLEDIVAGGYVVAFDSWMNCLVVWNGGTIFDVWSHLGDHEYRHVDLFTHFECAKVQHAKQIARKWIANQYQEMETHFGEAA